MPLTSRQVKKEIDDITTCLIEVGLSVSQNFANTKTNSHGVFVSFEGASNITVALKNLPYIELYRELLKSKSYNIKMIDGALIQLMYQFGENALSSHRLTYFPSPNLEDYQNARINYEKDTLYGDVVRENIVPFPVRFDFSIDQHSYREIYHSYCHMTLGEFNHCRVPVDAPLTPFQFISFVLRHFYVEDREEKVNRLYAKANRAFESFLSEDEKKVSYFRP